MHSEGVHYINARKSILTKLGDVTIRLPNWIGPRLMCENGVTLRRGAAGQFIATHCVPGLVRAGSDSSQNRYPGCPSPVMERICLPHPLPQNYPKSAPRYSTIPHSQMVRAVSGQRLGQLDAVILCRSLRQSCAFLTMLSFGTIEVRSFQRGSRRGHGAVDASPYCRPHSRERR